MLTLVFALTLQASVPPSAQYLEEAEALGRMSFQGGACSEFRILTVNGAAAEQLGIELERRAIAGGTTSAQIIAAINAGIDEQEQATRVLMTEIDQATGPERERLAVEAAEHYRSTCAALLVRYPSVFSAGERLAVPES